MIATPSTARTTPATAPGPRPELSPSLPAETLVVASAVGVGVGVAIPALLVFERPLAVVAVVAEAPLVAVTVVVGYEHSPAFWSSSSSGTQKGR